MGQPPPDGRHSSCPRRMRGRANVVWGVGDNDGTSGARAATTSCGARCPTATTSSGARRRRRQHRLGHVVDGDNIVWGTLVDGDNIVWGTAADGDNIVWGTDCGGADCDNIVWGSASDGDNIVWGTANDGDNIVWGTSMDANIVWATSADDDATWGSSGEDQVIFPEEDSAEPLPSLDLEFGDTVPVPRRRTVIRSVIQSLCTVIGPVSIGGI